MRKRQQLEVEDLGEFDIYPVKKKNKKFNRVTKDKVKVKRKVKKKGESREYGYFDDDGNEYKEEEVFWDLNGKLIDEVKRTEKVGKWNIVDKADIIGDFMSDSYYIAKCSKAVKTLWDSQIGRDKAISFVWKKSSRGMRFHRAYMFKFQSEIIIFSGKGNISKAVGKFRQQLQEEKESEKAKKKIKQKVTVTAEEVENEVEQLVEV